MSVDKTARDGKINKKLDPQFAGPVTDADRIAETSAAKIMTAAERDKLKIIATSDALNTPGIIGTDDNDNAWILLTPEGFDWKPLNDIKTNVDVLAPMAGTIAKSASSTPAVVMVDENGGAFASFAPEECVYKPFNDAQARITSLEAGGVSRWANLYPAAQVLHMIYYGQSLMAGRGTNAMSTSPLAYAYRYVGGVAAQDNIGTSSSATNHGSLVSHVETDMTDGGRGQFLYGETPAYGGALMLRQLYAGDGSTMGVDAPVLLSTVPAIGGQSIANLLPGGASAGWSFMTDDIAYAPARCSADLGRAYGGLGLAWQQGQADIGSGTAGSVYQSRLITLRLAAEALVQAAEGNARPFPVFMVQVAAHPSYGVADPIIARAQLQLCQTDAYFGFACPDYIFTRQSDGLHIVATSELWMGAYTMLCAYRWCVKGEKPVPLVPTAQRLGARTIALTFPVGKGRKLAIDTAIVAAQANYGFTAVNTSTSAALTISAVSIGGGGRVVYLTFAADLPAGVAVRYAWQSGDGKKGAGNLRDDDPLVLDPGGRNLPMFAWAPIFSLEV